MTEAADASDTSCSPERPPNITPIRRDTMDRYSSRRRFEIARGLRGDEENRHAAGEERIGMRFAGLSGEVVVSAAGSTFSF